MANAGSTVDASDISTIMCPQYDSTTFADKLGQEDCLVLNIYVPESALEDGGDKRSVMVWIHGGGLVFGANTMDTGDKYSPFPLIDNDVIVVTINYRLSYLGFMFMDTEDVPGNAGLRDQTMALQWVQDNIAEFGGDPGSVTIFGQSAGSWSVSYHLASPLSSGLFSRAILESGTSVSLSSSPVSPERALRGQQVVAEYLNCTGEDKDQVLACMQSKDPFDLVNVLAFPNADGGYAAPVVDADVGIPDPFLPAHTDHIFSTGQFNKDIEVMIGTTKDEAILFMMPALNGTQPWEDVQATFSSFFVQIMFNIPPDMITDEDISRAKEVLQFYCGNVEDINEENKQNFINMVTDSNFLYGSFKQVNYLLEQGVPTYQYILTHEGDHSFSTTLGYQKFGVCHGDDLQYLFEPSAITDSVDGEDAMVRDMMAAAWTQFAKTGDPSPPGASFSWTPVNNPNSHEFLDIDGPNPGMKTDTAIDERMSFWAQMRTN